MVPCAHGANGSPPACPAAQSRIVPDAGHITVLDSAPECADLARGPRRRMTPRAVAGPRRAGMAAAGSLSIMADAVVLSFFGHRQGQAGQI